MNKEQLLTDVVNTFIQKRDANQAFLEAKDRLNEALGRGKYDFFHEVDGQSFLVVQESNGYVRVFERTGAAAHVKDGNGGFLRKIGL